MTGTAPIAPLPGATKRNTDSLLPVLRALPPHCYERSTGKAFLYVGRAVAIYAGVLTVSRSRACSYSPTTPRTARCSTRSD